jgi:tellurite resistance protein TerC
MSALSPPFLWAGFTVLILAFLALDLGVLNRKDHEPAAGEALRWVAAWIAVALLFCGFVAWRFGRTTALDFLTGYVLELSLSVDNLFVFVLVFATFRVPRALQHRVLFWGIVGALVLRGTMIVAGAALLARFAWLIELFGAFLLVSGVKLLLAREERHPERSWAFRALRRVIPSTSRMEGHRFTLVEGGRRVATPLLLALVLIELADVVFALDSVPAVFGVTLDPFIVFTSNVFAILGLRSLYFVLARLMGRFAHLRIGLSAVLAFIGGKMLVSRWVHLPSMVSLAVVIALLGASMSYSVWRTGRAARRPSRPPAARERRADRESV